MKRNGFTLVEIIVCLILIVMVGTVAFISVKKTEKNEVITTTQIPSLVKDSVSIYTEKVKETIKFEDYCNTGESFECSYVTYGELVDNGLIQEEEETGYQEDDCFKISQTSEGLVNVLGECQSDTPVIVLTTLSEAIEMGEHRILKDYIKNKNPLDGNVTVKINGVTKDLNFDVSSLSGGTYNIVFSIKNSSNATASKTLVLTVEGSSLADIIKQKLPDCVKNGSEYDEDLCAFKGANPENYFWYSGFTWRVVGINKDGTVKAITQNPVGVLSWGEAKRTYESSYVREWLNELNSSDNYDGIFYNALNNPTGYLVDSKWDISGNPTTITMSTFDDYVGMITEREYTRASTHASDVSKQNYLNINTEFMTMTLAKYDYQEIYVRNVKADGTLIFRTQTTAYGQAHSSITINGVTYRPTLFSWANPEGVRPVVNFKRDLSVSGSGTESDPFKIDGETSGAVDSYLKDRHAGEYVKFGGLTWRIMESGSTTKIILNDFMKSGSNYVKKTFSTQSHHEYYEQAYNKRGHYYYSKDRYIQNARYSPTDSTNIGYYLNNTFYNSLSNNSWIVESSFPNSRHGAGGDYRIPLTSSPQEKNSTDYWTTTFYFTPVSAKIGLSSIGQLFSGDDIRVKTVCPPNSGGWDTCYKATMTQDSYFISYSLIVQQYDGTADASCMAGACSCIYRPITTLKSSIKIAGGTGTPDDPYTLKS